MMAWSKRPTVSTRLWHVLALLFVSASFATLLIERVVDALQCAVICRQIEVVVDRALRRQVFRDRAPLTAGRENAQQSAIFDAVHVIDKVLGTELKGH